jgi:hypothetical protein
MEQLGNTIRSATVIGGRSSGRNSRKSWTRLPIPGTDISPRRNEKILSQIKVISDRWRPFLSEAAASIAGDAGQAGR